MGAPFEVIAGPVEVWVAPLATAMPSVDTAPTGPWILLGANGSKNIEESGVTIHDSATVTPFRTLGALMPVKTFITSEDFGVEFTLADLTLEMWDKARGGPATAAGNVVTFAPTVPLPGTKSLNLVRNGVLSTNALLVRAGVGMSPYSTVGADYAAQYEFPKAICPGEGIQLVYVKGVPVGIHYKWTILYDPNIFARFQNAVHS